MVSSEISYLAVSISASSTESIECETSESSADGCPTLEAKSSIASVREPGAACMYSIKTRVQDLRGAMGLCKIFSTARKA